MISSEMHNSNNQHYASSSSGLVKRAFVSSWLNKKHKKAGGPGIEAALREISQRHPGWIYYLICLKFSKNVVNKQSITIFLFFTS
ncbi:hypothetical protein X798_05827, partial [Onchocerca flexuosa]